MNDRVADRHSDLQSLASASSASGDFEKQRHLPICDRNAMLRSVSLHLGEQGIALLVEMVQVLSLIPLDDSVDSRLHSLCPLCTLFLSTVGIILRLVH